MTSTETQEETEVYQHISSTDYGRRTFPSYVAGRLRIAGGHKEVSTHKERYDRLRAYEVGGARVVITPESEIRISGPTNCRSFAKSELEFLIKEKLELKRK